MWWVSKGNKPCTFGSTYRLLGPSSCVLAWVFLHTGCQMGWGDVFPLLQRWNQNYYEGRLVEVAVSLALPAVFYLSDLLIGSLILTFIGEGRLVYTLIGESRCVLGVHLF